MKRHSRRHRLGQHFLASEEAAALIADAAKISATDTVFELGTGRGMLTRMLRQRAAHVLSVEADARLASESRASLARFENLTVVCGDGLAVPRGIQSDTTASGPPAGSAGAAGTDGARYRGRGEGREAAERREPGRSVLTSTRDVFASNLPYSRSRTVVEQLASSRFGRCVIMVQKEFASKLLAKTAAEYAHCDRRAISIVAQYCFEMRVVMDVPASCFAPPPRVDSVVLRLVRKSTLGREQVGMITRMFSYRRKRISSVLRLICGPDCTCADILAPGGADRGAGGVRMDDLGVNDVVRLADCLLEVRRRQSE